MDGGASLRPSMHPHSNHKRNFSNMMNAASHRASSSASASPAPRDDYYSRAHSAHRRRRFEAELRAPRIRFPGDGLDFRRPLVSTSAAAADDGRRDDAEAAVIDLTREDSASQTGRDRRGEASGALPAEPRRDQRTRAREDGNVIELGSSGEEEADEEEDQYHQDTSNLPGAEYLDHPRRYPRPQYAGLRRPTLPPSPPTEMDEIQFIEQRPLRRSPSSSSATFRPQQRHATPYPAGLGETIDLTDDNDDVVHLNTRQREGVNNAPPMIPAAEPRARSFTDRGFEHIGQIANILRDGGGNIGGRLVRRFNDFAGQQRELPPVNQQRTFHDEYRLIRPEGPDDEDLWRVTQPAQREHHHHHHHHHHHRRPPNAPNNPPPRHHHHHHRTVGAVRTAGFQGHGVRNEMANMMNYAMTGFDLGLVGGGPARPPTPKYEAPAPAEEGFTRSPGEDEIVVCPNCGDELATGEEGPKQEIYVVKGCGHAYCGLCAINRNRPTSRKGKAPAPEDAFLPPKFKNCVVPGCGKPASAKSMVHVFLGS